MGFCCFSRMASKRSFQQERKGFHMFHHTESSSIKPVEFQIGDGLPGDQNDTSWISVGRHRFGVFVGPAYIPSNGKNKVQSCMGDVKGTPSPIRKRWPLFTQVSWVTGWGAGGKMAPKKSKNRLRICENFSATSHENWAAKPAQWLRKKIGFLDQLLSPKFQYLEDHPVSK